MIESQNMETLEHYLHRTIQKGGPLYNEGNKQGCYVLYLDAARIVMGQEKIKKSLIGERLEQAVEEASELGEKEQWGEAAWVLRHAFDEILGDNDKDNPVGRRRHTLIWEGLNNDGDSWQDAHISNTTDFEKGQTLADISLILRASIEPKQHTRYRKTYENCFQGSEAVEVLTSLGLAAHRKSAVETCQRLFLASFLVSVSHDNESKFRDGTRLYRFSYREELEAKLADLSSKERAEGSDDAICLIALETTLELPSLINSGETHENSQDDTRTFGGVAVKHLQTRRSSKLWSQEQQIGSEFAQSAAAWEPFLDIKDRKYNFKTYPKCFVGNEAVSVLVDKSIAKTREEAVQKLNKLLEASLIRHVTKDHLFEDKHLFYEFTPVTDVKRAIDTMAALPTAPVGNALVKYSALIQRYKQFAGLDVTEILNRFFGCEDESGWDLVDLDNWRNNMKRWGFGRREDQDDDMVAKLTPLCVNVDPDQWDVTGDEQWESPYGILAQIAIFDQVPRSAFRGSPDAFKWDHLAIRATKVALEKGYFETAFRSTLNQFLLLLPLEHSESWEDQKLGVTLLLQMLSTTAVEDEGWSDYEIVKRLEFSKRMTTAFLEHAQVIAKFKRYPHRNRAHGRTTTLEERVWLASDLVPRWAKSQNPEGARNIVKLPVIPLKKLTKK